MLAAVPDEGQMTALLGEPLYAVWKELCAIIDEKYDMGPIRKGKMHGVYADLGER